MEAIESLTIKKPKHFFLIFRTSFFKMFKSVEIACTILSLYFHLKEQEILGGNVPLKGATSPPKRAVVSHVFNALRELAPWKSCANPT